MCLEHFLGDPWLKKALQGTFIDPFIMDTLEFTAFFEVNWTFVSRQKCFFLYFSFLKYSILVVLSLSLGAVGGWVMLKAL